MPLTSKQIMNNSRRDFIKSVALAGAAAPVMSSRASVTADLPGFAKGSVELPPILTNVEITCNPSMRGKSASYFCDDAIWFLRDLSRQRPKSLFDTPFLAPLKECHDLYGLKAQINLFYRTDFFYGMDEFTLADVPDAYKAEWQANKDWLRLGFHSLQEFPDYPWINIDYGDVKKLFAMTFDQIKRFAGEGVFAYALVPHWCPMSKDGCRALKDCGIKLMECSTGPRYQYDGNRSRLPYGHGMKLEQNRKPETGFYWRDSRNSAITASICSYNHISPDQAWRTVNTYNFVLDHDTGMRFKNLFGDAPVLNLCTPETLRSDTEKVLGRDYLVFSNHEQYFFKHYLSYQPDYAEKIRLMSKMLRDNGYTFIFIEDIS